MLRQWADSLTAASVSVNEAKAEFDASFEIYYTSCESSSKIKVAVPEASITQIPGDVTDRFLILSRRLGETYDQVNVLRDEIVAKTSNLDRPLFGTEPTLWLSAVPRERSSSNTRSSRSCLTLFSPPYPLQPSSRPSRQTRARSP